MKKNKVYRSLGNLLLVKGIIGCIINIPIIIFMNMLLFCDPSSWCGGEPAYAILLLIIPLVFAIFNIYFIIIGINMRRTALSEAELDKKTGTVTTMIMLTIAITVIILAFFNYRLFDMIHLIVMGIMSVFGYGLWDIEPLIALLLGMDIFLTIAILVSCIGYHKQINSKKPKKKLPQ